MRANPLWMLLGLGSLLALPACPPPGGDDDDDSVGDDDDDDSVGDDDDSTGPASILLSGEVVTRSRESGGILSLDEYQERSGLLVVYFLEDPTDISNVLWKATLDGPGTFQAVLDPNLGPVYATVIADCDGNSIIEDVDIRRDYPFNPLIGGISDISDITLEIDVPDNCRGGDGGGGGGGGGGGDSTTISGPITLVNLPDAPIAIAAANEDYSGVGWWRILEAGATEYSIDVPTSLGLTTILGYHESDGNGLFEPADYTGEATSNPIQLGIGDVSGVEVVIPSGEPLDLPGPSGPVTLSGMVEYANYAGGDILVFASAGDVNGQLLAAQTLAAPGAFSLDVPRNFSLMVLWAVADPEGDGAYSLNTDANDLLGPFDTDNEDEGGLELELQDVPSNVNSLGGTITLNASAGPNDRLVVALIDDFTPGAPPVSIQYFGNPGATTSYEFLGLASGEYGVSAFLDVDSDATAGPDAEEPGGGSPNVVLSGGTVITNNDFSVGP